jgi:hypothetical protein
MDYSNNKLLVLYLHFNLKIFNLFQNTFVSTENLIIIT